MFWLVQEFYQEASEEAHMGWWVLKDKLLQAHAQQLQKVKGVLQKAKVDGQGALGTAQTHKRSTQEDSTVQLLPEDAGEVLGKPKLGWSLFGVGYEGHQGHLLLQAPKGRLRKTRSQCSVGGGDLVTKDMAEVLNAFLSWLSLLGLAVWPSRSSRVCESEVLEERTGYRGT